MNRPGFSGGSFDGENGANVRKSPKFSPGVIERAAHVVFDAEDRYPWQWAAIESIAGKIGCTAETLRKWVRQGERDLGVRPGPTTVGQHGPQMRSCSSIPFERRANKCPCAREPRPSWRKLHAVGLARSFGSQDVVGPKFVVPGRFDTARPMADLAAQARRNGLDAGQARAAHSQATGAA